MTRYNDSDGAEKCLSYIHVAKKRAFKESLKTIYQTLIDLNVYTKAT